MMDDYQKDREWLAVDFGEIEARLVWAAGQLDEPGVPERLSTLAADSVRRVAVARDTVLQIIDELPSASDTIQAQLVLRATSSLSAAEADVAAVRAAVEEEAGSDEDEDEDEDDGNATGVLDTVKKALKGAKGIFTKLARRLVKMISGLVTPKEWKLGGEVSAGVPGLGLSAVTIEITFGP